jgi:hypothetical protein
MNQSNQGTIVILTELPPSLRPWTDRLRKTCTVFLKKILFALTKAPRFMPFGGPPAVSDSLLRGFDILQVPYSYNVDDPRAEIICVLSDPAALRYAIKRKEHSSAKVIIAGPNIVHNPDTDNKLIQHPLIDRIILPSLWTRDWWISFSRDLKDRIQLWPAGVSSTIQASSHTGAPLVFIKNEEVALVEHIRNVFKKNGVPIKVLRYGTFTRSEYLQALREAKCMVYLSHTESQGIALAEAWMADVPTFVWNPGFFKIGGFSWKDERMSAPYLTPQCGTFFKDAMEFDRGIGTYLAASTPFSPRTYAMEYLSDEVSARRYLEIIGAAMSRQL